MVCFASVFGAMSGEKNNNLNGLSEIIGSFYILLPLVEIVTDMFRILLLFYSSATCQTHFHFGERNIIEVFN